MHSTVKELYESIDSVVSKVIRDNQKAIKLLFTAAICKSHILIDDVPGTGKTTLVKAFASAIDCSFGRIQFTPDLLPSDITGINYYNVKKSEFEFLPGPIFANFVLADEINRATPKTQSGLLECMQEGHVTVDGVTHDLPSTFMVIATQNPVENMGVFPLPEAQLDRFLLKISLGYPSDEETQRIISDRLVSNPLDSITPVASAAEIEAASKAVKKVFVHPDIISYIVRIVNSTREIEEVTLGASTRAALSLTEAARALAAIEGRDYVSPDNVKEAAPYVLAHRLILSASERLKKDSSIEIIDNILENTEVPTERGIRG